jgi:4-aminobutyrate aminotransferase-like enzyme
VTLPTGTGADFRGQGANAGNGIVVADGFQTGAGVTGPKVVVSTTITFDPPSLTTGAFAVSSGITVTGVALGDRIELYPPYDTQGIMYQGNPSAADTIKISLTSCAAGTVDLASGTWGVVVKRR